MSKRNGKRRNNETRNQSTNDAFNPAISPEEAAFIDSIINEEDEKADKKEKKSLLEQIGKENMGEIPGYQKSEKLAGNQGTIVSETAEEETEEDVKAEDAAKANEIKCLKRIYKKISPVLNKHGVTIKSFDEVVTCMEEFSDDKELIKLVNYDKFDWELVDLILEGKDALMESFESASFKKLVLDDKKKAKLEAIKAVASTLTPTTVKPIFKTLFKIDIDEVVEEMKPSAKTEESKTGTPKHETRKYVHEFAEDEELPDNVRIQNAAWYISNGYDPCKYVRDRTRYMNA